ncbi:hypothetical protein GWI33_001011 [Rhynchophorus ferrugineus]|uniref:Uncharacterized protein n=1 Tax=Rhynchophorus ferrugineus TaxID=354439 RepID=A0A834INP9_RHYFE|nr:hypothetical protein GWI33_001011 [Rhynchophorus ferrugineus]
MFILAAADVLSLLTSSTPVLIGKIFVIIQLGKGRGGALAAPIFWDDLVEYFRFALCDDYSLNSNWSVKFLLTGTITLNKAIKEELKMLVNEKTTEFLLDGLC